MKRFFAAFLTLGLLFASVSAEAGWLLRQNDDNTTEWVRTGSANTQETRTIGETYLTVFLEDVSTASTTYITIPVTDVRISLIQSTVFDRITTADVLLTIWRLDSAGANVTEITDGTGPRLTIASESVTGAVDTFTPTNIAVNTLERNFVIAIETDGASTGDVDVMITITLVPR